MSLKFNIEHRPDFSWLTVQLDEKQKIYVEASAMASMSSNIKMSTQFRGGLRRFISGESLFLSEFQADGIPGEVCIAPGPFGDMAHHHLDQQTIYLSSSSYVAHSEGVKYETKFQKLSAGFFSGAGWFLVKMTGTGDVWFNGYGALVEMNVEEELLIDNGHLVAFTEGLTYDIIKLGGYKSLFFSGEGLVCRFKGQGKVYVQTKKPSALVNWAHAFRRVQSSN